MNGTNIRLEIYNLYKGERKLTTKTGQLFYFLFDIYQNISTLDMSWMEFFSEIIPTYLECFSL